MLSPRERRWRRTSGGLARDAAGNLYGIHVAQQTVAKRIGIQSWLPTFEAILYPPIQTIRPTLGMMQPPGNLYADHLRTYGTGTVFKIVPWHGGNWPCTPCGEKWPCSGVVDGTATCMAPNSKARVSTLFARVCSIASRPRSRIRSSRLIQPQADTVWMGTEYIRRTQGGHIYGYGAVFELIPPATINQWFARIIPQRESVNGRER